MQRNYIFLFRTNLYTCPLIPSLAVMWTHVYKSQPGHLPLPKGLRAFKCTLLDIPFHQHRQACELVIDQFKTNKLTDTHTIPMLSGITTLTSSETFKSNDILGWCTPTNKNWRSSWYRGYPSTTRTHFDVVCKLLDICNRLTNSRCVCAFAVCDDWNHTTKQLYFV